MEKYTHAIRSEPNKNLFTENINYFEIGQDSIWGKGDEVTLNVLDALTLSGNWLDLGAGDGRYAFKLLTKAKRLTAADIDPGALSKLWYRTPQMLQDKLDLVTLNLTEPLPFQSNCFDGIICTGILHFFAPTILMQILVEMDRVLKPLGSLVLDFAFGIRRYSESGVEYIREGSHKYDTAPTELIFTPCLPFYEIELQISDFESDLTTTHGYILSGKFALIVASKPNNLQYSQRKVL